MNRSRRPRATTALALAVWVLAVGCLYDASDRCGPDQELSGTQACVCRDGLVLVGTSCVPCPEHELELESACQCQEGYERPAEGQACLPIIEGGLGVSCSAAEPCVDPVFDTCQAGGVLGQYCTKRGCASDQDCDVAQGYGCQLHGPEPFCQREPLGQGDECASAEDCAGGDASYCEAFQNHRCLVPDCNVHANDCSAGWQCCDLSVLGIPGLPASLCAPEGMCP